MDSENTTRSKLESYVAALTGCGAPIDDDAPLSSLGVDSISLVKILVYAERSLGARLSDADLDGGSLATFGGLAAAVAEMSEKKG
jgi:acyl carrier protein